MLVFKNKLLTTSDIAIFIVIYDYGVSNSKGKVLFTKPISENSCVGIINPCKLCIAPIKYYFYFFNSAYRLTCTEKGFPVFEVGLKCLSVYMLPDKFTTTNQTCQWQMLSFGSNILKFTLSLRAEYIAKGFCLLKTGDFKFSNPVMIGSYGDVKILQYSDKEFETRSYQFKFNYQCFVNQILDIKVKVADPKSSECETYSPLPAKTLEDVPKYDGPCFMFYLKSVHDNYAFDISFLSDWATLKDYPNQFAVAAYKENSAHLRDITTKNSLYLTIQDGHSNPNNVLSYMFTEEQMPFVWHSYGQQLRIMVNGSQRKEDAISVWIIVNAIFEVHSLFSYLIYPYEGMLAVNCLEFGSYSLGDNSCFSIHSDFSGAWLEAKELCKKRKGNLWRVESAAEWKEVMRSNKFNWYRDEEWSIPINFEYDGRMNAAKLLQSSSLIYLGLEANNENVRTKFV